MIVELFTDISGYEGLYRISTYGRVYSLRSRKFIKPNVDRDGYLLYHLGKKGRKVFKAHRLVAMHFISNPNMLKEVNHLDGNKQNNSVQNLEWADDKMQVEHSMKLGLTAVGDRLPQTKLSWEQVVEVRALRQKGLKLKEIAEKYDVTFQLISKICKGHCRRNNGSTDINN